MPRPPSKHGLERKYKPWRKGKSKTSKSKGSLKHQLRGKQRLLAKVTEPERRSELKEEIRSLEQQINERKELERTKQNAKDSHGVRFLERQRLTRAERSTRKLLDSVSTTEETNRYQQELQRIALDQVYVAHFPHDIKYIPLFRNGVRVVDTNVRKLVKRATTRKRILKNISEKASWISADQYERLPKEWSVEMEKKMFCTPAKGDSAEAEINDNRFTMPEQHAALLQAAEQAEAEIQAQEANVEEMEKKASESESSASYDPSNSDSSSDDEADPLKRALQKRNPSADDSSDSDDDDDDDEIQVTAGKEKNAQIDDASDSDSSSGSDSSGDDEDEVETTLVKGNSAQSSDSSSSDDDSSSDSDSIVENEPVVTKKRSNEPPPIEEEFDDFLMPATTNDANVFEKAKQDAPQYVKGDKSKGWATQRQRPGQFKKRRVR